MSITNMAPPHTYAEWCLTLDALKKKKADEEILKIMLEGTVEWQSGVAERFSKKLIDTINYRMNNATDRFQREISKSLGQERAIVQALLTLRRELIFLSKAINIPALPDRERQQCYQLVISHANSIQDSLEDSAKKDRSGKLTSIIHNNRVNSF